MRYLNILGQAPSFFLDAPKSEWDLQWGVEITGIGDWLVAVLKVYQYDGLVVYLLVPHIVLDEVITQLCGEGRLSALLGLEIPSYNDSLQRYVVWRDRAEPSNKRNIW